jgi:hypothetical protein
MTYWQILQGVNGHIYATLSQSRLQFLGEQTFSTDLGQGLTEIAVALRCDDLQSELPSWPTLCKKTAHGSCLPARKPGGTSCYDHFSISSRAHFSFS